MSQELTGKVALVTGASRGIGAAIAKRLASDGAAVAITYFGSAENANEVVKLIESLGGKATAIRADNADADAVRLAVRKTIETFGRLDILVNNAGFAILGPPETFSLEDFDRVFAVNVRGAFVAIQEACKHMGEGGRIINIGSGAAERMPWPGVAVYTMTKSALAGLTRGLARDLGPRGITVNNVQPGPTDTDGNPADGPDAGKAVALSAIGRFGHPDEVAAMVAYLARPEAALVTAASLTIDGGLVA
jgi:3-oxoacyl-[acyl-carrier protein] reductase